MTQSFGGWGSRSGTVTRALGIVGAIAMAVVFLLALAPGSALARQLKSLGTPPAPCIPLGSTTNVCGFNAATGEPPNFMPSTFYGQLDMSPHIVRLGQTATEIIEPNTNPVSTHGQPVSTRWFPPGDPEPGSCLNNPNTGNSTDYSCPFKVTQVGDYGGASGSWRGGWSIVELSICGFLGCSPSGTFWDVLADGRAVSGTVLDAAGDPVAGVTVDVSGPTSGTVKTDSSGFYDAIALNPGRYSVSVAERNGQATRCTPGSANGRKCALDLNQADGEADFAVCPSAAGDSPAADVARIAAAPSSAACPLDVTIKRLDGDKTGLSDVLDSPEFMDGSGKCESGCSDLKVTVTDPAKGNQAVQNATITASVAAVPAGDLPQPNHDNLPGFPSGADPGEGYLCAETSSFTTASPGCAAGRLIQGVTTDSQGNAYLRYWAPGIITADSPKVKVIARETCSATACPATQKLGHQSIVVKLSPNAIYKASGTLTLHEADELAEWTSRFGIGVKFFASQGFEAGAEALINRLVHDEEEAEKLSGAVSGVLNVAEFAHAVWEQQLALAEFLEPLGLSGTGLGRPPDASSVSAVPGLPFLSAVEDDGTPPLHLGHKGLMWNLGETLLFRKEDKDGSFGAQFIHVDVYEVSFCDFGTGCGPGYHGQSGIEPFLYFDFTSERNSRNHVYEGTFVIPYNAAAWFLTPKNLRQLP